MGGLGVIFKQPRCMIWVGRAIVSELFRRFKRYDREYYLLFESRQVSSYI
jgi:hypothetical protein